MMCSLTCVCVCTMVCVCGCIYCQQTLPVWCVMHACVRNSRTHACITSDYCVVNGQT